MIEDIEALKDRIAELELEITQLETVIEDQAEDIRELNETNSDLKKQADLADEADNALSEMKDNVLAFEGDFEFTVGKGLEYGEPSRGNNLENLLHLFCTNKEKGKSALDNYLDFKHELINVILYHSPSLDV